VFDKDTHESYRSALQLIKSVRPGCVFYVINSAPCFEYWLLLHFCYTEKPFHGTTGAKSSGDQVLDELKKYIVDYAKGNHGYFERLIDKLPQAILHSTCALKSANASDTDNPTTLVHELVEYLQEVSKNNTSCWQNTRQ